MIAFLTLSAALASSLDNIEVGGVHGTPAATNPTAVWWNPAGLSLADGFQFHVEGAPILANLHIDRANPDYGTIDPANALDVDSDGVLDLTYDYGGEEDISTLAVVPFVGVSYGKGDFGFGAAFSAPMARGGSSNLEEGPNRFALRGGDIAALHAQLAAGYDIADKLAIGLSGALVASSWSADVDTEVFSTYATAYRDQAGLDAIPAWYQDGYLEADAYATTLDMGPLRDTTFTFGGGLLFHPTDDVHVAVAYQHGLRLSHDGPITLSFTCPPAGDGSSSLAAAYVGTCRTDMTTFERVPNVLEGTANVAYDLPSRIHGSVAMFPTDTLRLELMGGWVNWSVFEAYTITTNVEPEVIPGFDEDPETAKETADLVSQDRIWLRGNRDSFWVGFDAKAELSERWVVGGRTLYDHGAVPSAMVSANNWDAPSVSATAMGQYRPTSKLGISLSYGHTFFATRTITDSAFALEIAEDGPPEPGPTFWASGNGTYSGRIDRIGLSVQGHFGPDPERRAVPREKPDPGPR